MFDNRYYLFGHAIVYVLGRLFIYTPTVCFTNKHNVYNNDMNGG